MKDVSVKRFRYLGCMLLLLLTLCALLFISACSSAGTVYKIEIEGEISEAGVISYLGYTMNVYKDVASNPCGDCDDQPISVYVGDNNETVAAALKQAVTIDFVDGDWVFDSLDGNTVTFRIAEGIDIKKADVDPPSAPAGLSIKGGFDESKGARNSDRTSAAIPDNPQRLAAVYGPSYEALTLLGVEDRIVSRADVQTENFPWAYVIYKRIDELPVLEDVHAAVNVETLLSSKPDLVYTFPRPNEIALLEKAKIGYIQGETTRTLEDVKGLLYKFAEPLGDDAKKRADAYSEYFDERLAYVKEKTDALSEEDRPLVYYAGTDILTTYGRHSDVIEVIEAAGGTAVTKDLEGGNRVNTDAEKLSSWNPDYIFIDHCGMSGKDDRSADEIAEAAYANAKYSGITAIKNKDVVLTPSGVFYWDMGLQKILLVQYMAKQIHPELFSDLDMAAEIQRFYTEFFEYPLSYEDATKILERKAPDA